MHMSEHQQKLQIAGVNCYNLIYNYQVEVIKVYL